MQIKIVKKIITEKNKLKILLIINASFLYIMNEKRKK